MPDFTPTKPGEPIWLDLVTTDEQRAIEFYSRLFGWDSSTATQEFGGYVTFSLGGRRVAGLGGDTSTGVSAWTVYLSTTDAARTASAAEAAGGTVLFTHPVADLGRMSVMVDPSGAVVGAWEPGTHTGFSVAGEAGASVWNELHTDDFAAAVRFYESVFGWSAASIGDTDEFRMATYGSGPEAVAGIYDAAADLGGAPSRWLPYFGVADADAAAALLVDLGGTQLAPVRDTPFGRMCHVLDPMGAPFAIIQETS